mmetsp:Transcript_13112/g.52291  ORF Transcript_13112/g.52291 Transcript_13112/m.52291 type:complete len:205 (+) Transcript_13112:477-1091(+)
MLVDHHCSREPHHLLQLRHLPAARLEVVAAGQQGPAMCTGGWGGAYGCVRRQRRSVAAVQHRLVADDPQTVHREWSQERGADPLHSEQQGPEHDRHRGQRGQQDQVDELRRRAHCKAAERYRLLHLQPPLRRHHHCHTVKVAAVVERRQWREHTHSQSEQAAHRARGQLPSSARELQHCASHSPQQRFQAASVQRARWPVRVEL